MTDTQPTATTTIRKNHIGQFTATIILPDQGRIHAWGTTKDAAAASARQKLASYIITQTLQAAILKARLEAN